MIAVYTGSLTMGSYNSVPFKKGVPSFLPDGHARAIASRNDFEVYSPDNPAHQNGGETIYVCIDSKLRGVACSLWAIDFIHRMHPTCSIAVQTLAMYQRFLPSYCSMVTSKAGTYYREFDIRMSNTMATNATMAVEVPIQFLIGIATGMVGPDEMNSAKTGFVNREWKAGTDTVVIGNGDVIQSTVGHGTDLADKVTEALGAVRLDYTQDWDEKSLEILSRAGKVVALGESSYTAIALTFGIPVFFFEASNYALNMAKQHNIYANANQIRLAGINSLDDIPGHIVNAVNNYRPQEVVVKPTIDNTRYDSQFDKFTKKGGKFVKIKAPEEKFDTTQAEKQSGGIAIVAGAMAAGESGGE